MTQPTQCFVSGLPGNGVRRFAQALAKVCPVQVWPAAELHALEEEVVSPGGICLWVVDVRQDPDQLVNTPWLFTPLRIGLTLADAVIFQFPEHVDLPLQAKWQKFIQTHAPELTVFRSFSQQLPADLPLWLKDRSQVVDLKLPKDCRPLIKAWQNWQRLDLVCQRLSLEMLMMALANSQQSLGMKIGRVQGLLPTIEYENCVVLEVNGFHWQTYGASQPSCDDGWLRIEGLDLDKSWFEQLLIASVVS